MNNKQSHKLANMLKCLELILNEKRDEMSVVEISDILNKINDIYNIEAEGYETEADSLGETVTNHLRLPILYMKNREKLH